jgi:hypothetical protein
MNNCFILGSGRSGTSMVAGTLAESGYFMGDNLYPPRDSNPKGFFEDPFINGINEEILSSITIGTHRDYIITPPISHLSDSQRWLEILPLNIQFGGSEHIKEKIKTAVKHTPYCFKDPRFSYTLPVWLPHLRNTAFICIFREPAITAASIVKECTEMEYLQTVKMNFDRALNVWFSMYNHILRIHMHSGKWLFIHYDQVATPQGISRLEGITGATVDSAFVDNTLKRTTSNHLVGGKYQVMYYQLCNLAGHYS